MESESSDRIPWERQYYGDIRIPNYSKTIKCKMCGTAYVDDITKISYHIGHLKTEHYITELTNHPEREFFLQKFTINEENFEAKCICERVIVYNMYGLYLLKNHVEIYHGNSSHIYKIIAKTESGRDTLDKYIIMGSEATCPKCELKIDMTHSETQVVEKVKELLEHYFSHSSISQHAQDEFKKNVDEELKKAIKKHVRELELKKRRKLVALEFSTKTFKGERIDLKEPRPRPSTSSSTADDRTERSEQSEIPQNIPMERPKSSTLDEIQLKARKEDEQTVSNYE